VRGTAQTFIVRSRSAASWPHLFRTCYGPTNRSVAAFDAAGRIALEADLLALAGQHIRGGPDGLIVLSLYLSTRNS
jgi:hypothetical protein